MPLDVIEAEGPEALTRLVPMCDLLSSLPHVVVNERGARRAAHGNALGVEDLWQAARTIPPSAPPGPVRVLDADGTLLAIGEPGMETARRAISTIGLGSAAVPTSCSGSTSVAQSRSVTEFHCDPIAFS